MRATIFGLISILAAACGGGGGMTGDDVGGGDGMAEVTFAVTATVRSSPALVDALIGTTYVGIFHAEDVTTLGPNEGAEAAEYLTLDIDLEAATVTPAVMSMPLIAGDYELIGFFDLDGNGASLQYPDAGDPVMLPGEVFSVADGQTVTVSADFDLVFN
jgi:hypothetical protein